MPDSKGSLHVAGVLLRRKERSEFHSYVKLFDYDPSDYEILLRSTGEPFQRHLDVLTTPAVWGQSTEATAVEAYKKWSDFLASSAGVQNARSLEGRRAVFLSVHGGEKGVTLCYAVPITQSESKVVSSYPNTDNFPKFYNLANVLKGMVELKLNIHPQTREMLSSLDRWLREQHAISSAINLLFSPSPKTRLKMFVVNPVYQQSSPIYHKLSPLKSGDLEEKTEGHCALALRRVFSELGAEKADMVATNPFFSSSIEFRNEVNMLVINKHFGQAKPDYKALTNRRGKWTVEVTPEGPSDWVEMYPLHRCVCQGDLEGMRQCFRMGASVNESDTDSWTPLHYACWYGELDTVKVLVEEASAALDVTNAAGSTPLHLAAATGHTSVVSYLLTQGDIDAVKTALDNEGKSPLAVCLEFKMNDWQGVAQVLREAYGPAQVTGVSSSLLGLHLNRSLFQTPSRSPRPPAINPLLPIPAQSPVSPPPAVPALRGVAYPNRGGKRLSVSVSVGNLPEKKNQTVRRQRVNFMNGTHQVAHFFRGSETSASEAIQDVFKMIQLGKQSQDIFALWVVSESLELQLGDTDKPLKIMTSWGDLLKEYCNGQVDEVPSLYLRRNIFYPVENEKSVSDAIALGFLYANALKLILSGYYPCSEDDALYLAGLTMQLEYGDHSPEIHRLGFLKDKLEHILPASMVSSKRRVEYERKVLVQHSEISQLQVVDSLQLEVIYLTHCWQWPYYGASFYEGTLNAKMSKVPKQKLKANQPVLVGVNSQGLHLLNSENNVLLCSVPHDGLEWDMSADKEIQVQKPDGSLVLHIHIKKAALLYSIVTRIKEQSVGDDLSEEETLSYI
eukprot:Em0023g433a